MKIGKKSDFKRIWVTGAGGLIGSHLQKVPISPDLCLMYPLHRGALNLCDFRAVDEWFSRSSPDAVIHCAAMSKTGACQRDPDQAWLQNVTVTEHLAALARDIPFVFFSTDLVFGGDSRNYREESPTNPRMWYGTTKVAAEKVVLRNPRHLVLRTSINFGDSPTGDRAFNEDMLLGWVRGVVPSLFVDEFRCPIAAKVTAELTLELLEKGACGLFHFAGGERLSRYEIGCAVAEFYRRRIGRGALDISAENLRVNDDSLKNYQGPPRCPDASMDVSKIEAFLGRKVPRFTEWIAEAT